MGVLSDAAQSSGDVMRRLAELERQVQQLQTSRRLEAATIGAGGVRVRGGQIDIEDPDGNVMMTLSTDGLALEGRLVVTGGADIDLQDGGTIQARYPNNVVGVKFGSLVEEGTDQNSGHGLLVQGDTNDDIFRAVQAPDGTYSIRFGSDEDQVDFFLTNIGQQAQLIAPVIVAAVSGLAYGVQVQSNALFLFTPDTTSNSANVWMDPSTGFVARVTSSAEAKQDTTDLPVDIDAVMRLRPRTWRDRSEVQRDPESDRWHVGLLAEEVDEAGLTEFVEYGQDGEPQAVAYDRLVVALLEVLREQQRRLDVLDGGVTRTQPTGRKPKRRQGYPPQPAAPMGHQGPLVGGAIPVSHSKMEHSPAPGGPA